MSGTSTPTPTVTSTALHQISQPPPTNSPGWKSHLSSTASSTPSSHMSGNVSNIFNGVFNKSNIILFVTFLLVYMLFYGIMYFVLGGNISNAISSRVVDIFALIIFVFFVLYYYFGSSEADIENAVGVFLVEARDFLNTPSSIFTMILIIILKYMFMYITGVPMGINKPYSVMLLEGLLWGTFILDVFGVVFKLLFGFSIIDLIFNPLIEIWGLIPMTTPTPTTVDLSNNITTSPPTTTPPPKEVYNVSNNLYTYEEAQAICDTYGARLATYDDIEKSYNDGGEWCNYGWSEGQMALFPTQKNTWNKLQLTKTHKNDCGRPGINGGYMANPYIKFGVNCYGVKPTPGPNDHKGELTFDDPSDKNSADTLDMDNVKINSFNYDKWSEFKK
jgi:Extracellular link domain